MSAKNRASTLPRLEMYFQSWTIPPLQSLAFSMHLEHVRVASVEISADAADKRRVRAGGRRKHK